MYSYMHPIFTFCSHLVILKSIKNTKQGHVDGPCYFKSWLFYGKILVLQVNIIELKNMKNQVRRNHDQNPLEDNHQGTSQNSWRMAAFRVFISLLWAKTWVEPRLFCFCAWPQFNLLFKWVYWLHPFNKINNCVVLGWSAFPEKKCWFFFKA